MRPPELEWTGEYVDVDLVEWWCPTEKRLMTCPGPCPDGTAHGHCVRSTVKAKAMRVADR